MKTESFKINEGLIFDDRLFETYTLERSTSVR